MSAIILSAFLPVFAVIALGYGVRASGYLPRPFWRGVNALNHRLLLPAFLISVLAGADFSHPAAGKLAALSVAGTLILLALSFSAVLVLGLRRAGAPVIAVAVQWNFVLTLALVQRLVDTQTAPLAAAVVAPGVLLGAIITVGGFALAGGAGPGKALVRVARDPMVIAVIAGLAANAAGLADIQVLADLIAVIGAGALAVVLLSMGAGLDFSALRGRLAPLATGAALRCIGGPAVFVGLGVVFGVSGPAALILAIAGAAPGAAFVYAVAADFEVEPELTAGLLTLTVVCSAVIAPLVALFASGL